MKAELIEHEPLEVPPPEVQLTLSYKEASALLDLCGDIAGETHNTIRNLTNKIYWELRNLGLVWPNLRPLPQDYSVKLPQVWDKYPDRPNQDLD